MCCATGLITVAQTNFRHISFDEAIAAAKQENKMVFIDFYTDWCGPCKMMAKEVFPQKKVGDYFNEKFVCVKFNAEKEGKELAARYQVKAYPTFIVLNTKEELQLDIKGAANADDFIQRLPEGYNTMLTGNGASLSQGQRQLISIARAAVADPPVMILDEATSSIDTRTEALVQEGMDNLMMGRTVFVIAHRLSTVRNSKAIMVLDHGHIIERGDHETLIAQKGVYYQLYTGAFELE